MEMVYRHLDLIDSASMETMTRPLNNDGKLSMEMLYRP